MRMDAHSLILRYSERLAWSSDETRAMLAAFIDKNDLIDSFKAFLIEETGIALGEDESLAAYRGKPFAVLGFRAGSRKPDERIDTDSEVLALEAFSELLSRPDLENFAVVQFRFGSEDSRELLRYDRRMSVEEW